MIVRALTKYIPITRGTWSVLTAQVIEASDGYKNKNISISGDNLPQELGVPYEYEGTLIKGKYGKQLKVTSWKLSVGSSEAEIVGYLSSGLFKGIGKKTAKEIYKRFGEQSIDIIQKTPDKLQEVSGIGPKATALITKQVKDDEGFIKFSEYLHKFHINPKTAADIMVEVKDDVGEGGFEPLDAVKLNPYRYYSIDFITAERIAQAEGIEVTRESRLMRAVDDTFRRAEAAGHLGISAECIVSLTTNYINKCRVPAVSTETVLEVATKMIRGGYFAAHNKADGRTLLSTLKTEKIQSSLISSLKVLNQPIEEKIDIEQAIKNARYVLDDSQIEAVKTATRNHLSIITGGPGTGKSTISETVIEALTQAHPDYKICQIAPTGKAARRLEQATGREASTIHAKLRIYDEDETEKALDIEEDIVIVDEASMIDLKLAEILFTHIKPEAIVIIMGDVDQLQSVGAGAVLRDMINSGVIPTARLTTTHRQASGSLIIENANRIKEGNTMLHTAEDFRISSAGYEQVLRQYIEDIRTYGTDNTVILAPLRKQVEFYNREIQERVNPADEQKAEIKAHGELFRENDRVMELKNTDEASNGDIGRIDQIDVENKEIYVTFENGNQKVFTKENIDELTLAYAMTIHKSQGSEYDSVIMTLTDEAQCMLTRSLLYTGITRAKKQVRLYGTKEQINTAINNKDTDKRLTTTAEVLKASAA